MVLYDLKADPLERNNVAYDPEYEKTRRLVPAEAREYCLIPFRIINW